MADLPSQRDESSWDASPLAEAVRPAPVTRLQARMLRRGRARALQALYAADVRDFAQLRRIASHLFDDLALAAGVRDFASRLIATVADRGSAFDAALAEVTNNWRLERLGVIERCVLRLAAAELDRREVPVKVVLQEAVQLAERYGSERSALFVNGVLDAYARRLGRL